MSLVLILEQMFSKKLESYNSTSNRSLTNVVLLARDNSHVRAVAMGLLAKLTLSAAAAANFSKKIAGGPVRSSARIRGATSLRLPRALKPLARWVKTPAWLGAGCRAL